VVASRLETIMDRVPREGAKAAVALGIIERVREIVDAAMTAVKLAECVGAAKGTCKETFCDPACARIFMVKEGETIRIGKYRSNTLGVTIEQGRVIFATSKAKLIVDSSGTVEVYLVGINENINISDVNDVYRKSYMLKRAIREVGGRIDVIVSDLRSCARANAIVC